MRYLRFLAFLSVIMVLRVISWAYSGGNNPAESTATDIESIDASLIYTALDLSAHGLSFQAFETAVKGMKNLISSGCVTNENILSIVDLSQSSCQKRLYIIDLVTMQLLYQTYVAHGRNSGEEFANSFSNKERSHRSSLGFYTTLDTYEGDHGLSLRLEGMEKGFNDNAFDRAIVMHGADYVSQEFISENGRLGRSLGCPAIPQSLTENIIDLLKCGSCLFIYYPDAGYLKTSRVLN